MKVIIVEEAHAFIKKLEDKARSKVRGRIDLLGQYGHMLRMPHSRYVLPGIYELRVVGKDNIRLIYTFMLSSAVIFHAYVKKTEEISNLEMNSIKHRFRNLQLLYK